MPAARRRHVLPCWVSACLLALGGALPAAEIGLPPVPVPVPPPAADQPQPPASPALPELPAPERAALLAVAEQAVALGLPDARGGALFQGCLTISWSGKKADGTMRPQTRNCRGMHVRRTDGSWLVGMDRLWGPGHGSAIETGRLKPVTAPDLARRLTGNASPDEESAGDGQPARQRQLDIYALAYSASPDHRFPPYAAIAIALMRLGLPEAERLGLHLAAHQALADVDRSDAAFPPLGMDQGPSDYRGGFRRRGGYFFQGTECCFSVRNEDETPPAAASGRPPATILRRQCALWFQRQILCRQEPFAPLTDAQALAGARALTEPGDAATLTELARLEAWLRLPRRAAANADLPSRLSAWDGRIPTLGSGASTDDGDEQVPMQAFPPDQDDPVLPITVDTASPSPDGAGSAGKPPPPAFLPGEFADLVALAGDTRPSCWLQGERVRTIGDQALRAMAAILGCDPRLLVGRNPAAAWDDGERSATARALQAWWSAHRQHPLPETIAEVLPTLPLTAILPLLVHAEPGLRDRWCERLAQSWRQLPAAVTTAPELLGSLLVAGRAHAALATTIDGWPASGPVRLPLAIWQLARGHRQAFDDAVEAALTSTTEGHPELEALLPVICRHPRAADLQHFQLILIGRPDQPPVLRLLGTLSAYPSDSLAELHQELASTSGRPRSDGQRNRLALPLALMAQLLGDPRPLPPSLHDRLTQLAARLRQSSDHAQPSKDQPPPALKDPRLADLGAVCLLQAIADEPLRDENDDKAPIQDLRFDPCTPLSERSLAIRQISHWLHPVLTALLKDARLPTVIPGFDALAFDSSSDKSLF